MTNKEMQEFAIFREAVEQSVQHLMADYKYALISRILEIIERLNHNGSVSIKLLRKEIEALKGGDQE